MYLEESSALNFLDENKRGMAKLRKGGRVRYISFPKGRFVYYGPDIYNLKND